MSLTSTDISTINTVRASGTPYVIVLVSGRPMTMTTLIANANALVAAWLPGTEGKGVADVLFGDFGFTGRLSFSWPRDMNQLPINIGDSGYDPLYPFGYGLATRPDLDNDGDVDIMDLQAFCDSWQKIPADADYDSRANLYDDPIGVVDFYDYAIFAAKWKTHY